MPEIEGFGDGYQSEAELDMRALVQEQNRKKKKSGGFQSMGLSYNIFQGIMKCCYKIPTPIQRKVFILENDYFNISIHITIILLIPSSVFH